MTSAPSSCSRMTVTQYSRSSNPSATSTAIFCPSNLMRTPSVEDSSGRDPAQELVHFAPRLFAAKLEGAAELGYGVSPPPNFKEPFRGLQVCPKAVLLGVSGIGHIRHFFPVYQGEKFVPVAGGAAQADTLYSTELVHGAWFAGGDLLQVRVVEHDVGGHLLLFRLLAPPAPQPLEEIRVQFWTV